jgi:transcriptional regulator with XRE-family HTH domain
MPAARCSEMPRVITSVTLGDRVYRLRQELGWSGELLARHMRNEGHSAWHHTQVYMVERGTRHLRVHEAYSLADILRVSLDDLVFGMEGDDIELMLASKARKLLVEREVLQERLVQVDKLLMGYRMRDLRYWEVS